MSKKLFFGLVLFLMVFLFTSLALAQPAILIQGAMPIETSELVKNLKEVKKETIDGWDFWQGTINGKKVVIAETKIGSINAAISTMLAIKKYKPQCIINQGTAGGYAKFLHLNDIILADKIYNISAIDTKHRDAGKNLDVYEWDIRKHFDNTEFPVDLKLMASAENTITQYKAGKVYKGALASSERWSREIDYINYFHKEKNILAEEMESAAVAQIAATYNIPFIAVRVISDNEINNELFTMEAAEKNAFNCQVFIMEMLKNM